VAQRERKRAKEHGHPPIVQPMPQDLQQNAAIDDFLNDSGGDADNNPHGHFAQRGWHAAVCPLALAYGIDFPLGIHECQENDENDETCGDMFPSDGGAGENVLADADGPPGEICQEEHEGVHEQSLPMKNRFLRESRTGLQFEISADAKRREKHSK